MVVSIPPLALLGNRGPPTVEARDASSSLRSLPITRVFSNSFREFARFYLEGLPIKSYRNGLVRVGEQVVYGARIVFVNSLDLFGSQLAANKRLNTAYVLKESFGQLWDYNREARARKF